jgi:GTP-binding protein
MSADRTRPVVAIVGRPNVGKSTLFNRIAGRRLAIVEDRPGITRDRNYAPAEHEGRGFLLVDTGGFEPDAKDRLIQQVRDQARLAVDEAQAVILVVDGTAGPTPVDVEIAEMLRRGGKPLILAVNKIDSSRREEEEFLSEFYRLGLAEVFPVSAEHARGVGDMLDRLLAFLPDAPKVEPEAEAAEEAGGAPFDLDEEAPEEPPEPPAEEDDRSKPIRIAILGRPNVGKSTLLNSLIGEERFVTSPVAGTTRDPVDAEVERRGRRFVLTDTAGIRRKRSIALKVEAYSVLRALKAAEQSDVVVVLLDATEFVVEQDAKIAGLAEEQGKPLLVVVNKWDLIQGDEKRKEKFLEDLRWKLPWIAYAPVLFLSALERQGTERVLSLAEKLYDQAGARVPTAMLNRVLAEISEHHALPVIEGKRARIYYIAQTHRRPPVFSLVTNRPDRVPPDYRRYVANKLRDVFGLEVPIRLAIRRKAGARSGPSRGRRR